MFIVKNYDISSPLLPESFHGYKLVQISDLHGRVWGKDHRLLLKAIHRVSPDVVVITGDLFGERPAEAASVLSLCKQLANRYPVYFISGNHEQRMEHERMQRLYYGLRRSGVTLLDNRSTYLYYGARRICLYGLTTPLLYYKDPLARPYDRRAWFHAKQIEELLGPADPKEFTILLAHNPLYFPSYQDWGARLTLAGHIHGGIIRIPGLGGLLSPDVTFFPKYYGGHYREKDRDMIVSSGLSNTLGVRINNPMELVAVTLIPLKAL